jgi:hypothetical protein
MCFKKERRVGGGKKIEDWNKLGSNFEAYIQG